MARAYWRFMKFPETNVAISLVDMGRLQQLSQAKPNQPQTNLRGVTLTRFVLIEGKVKNTVGNLKILGSPPKVVAEHEIYAVTGLPKARLMAVCAHELGHVWLHENLKESRQIDANTTEGFCELLAYQLMDALGHSLEKSIIQSNTYTLGQQFNMIEAEKQYGFYRILEWMKNGVDKQISASNLDRIRVVEPPAQKNSLPAFAGEPYETIAPDKLILKGISGSDKRRLVLINNQTIGLGERARVRVGKTNLTVQCLEIRDRSVLIQVQETDEKQELFLSPPVKKP